MSGDRTKHLDEWRRSAIWRAISRHQCFRMIAAHAAKPRCGAKTRVTGDPCRQPAGANGRCRFHGGRTPKGRDWHRPQFPAKDAPGVVGKIDRKVADLAKRARKRAKRLAKKAPDERAAHQRWHATHKPGDPKQRAAARERRRQDLETVARIAEWDAVPARPRPPEDAEIAEMIEVLRARLAASKPENDVTKLDIFQ